MLSTRLGYFRPAFLAERLAAAFLAGDSFLDFFPLALRGLAFFHGGLRAICPLRAVWERKMTALALTSRARCRALQAGLHRGALEVLFPRDTRKYPSGHQ